MSSKSETDQTGLDELMLKCITLDISWMFLSFKIILVSVVMVASVPTLSTTRRKVSITGIYAALAMLEKENYFT